MDSSTMTPDPTHPATQVSIVESEIPSSIFALIIGINKYTSIPGLNGAVADAQSFRRYLKTLRVPDDQILDLIDSHATRSAIIQALKDFQDDRRIRRETDCIVIFYAGHGGEKDAPHGWEARGSKVQMILPVDFQNVLGDGLVQGIPDRTIARLLDDIAEKKGNNIVVIFDCCHSGGANRKDNGEDDRTARSVEILHAIPPNLDGSIWDSPADGRGIEYQAGFLHKGRRSHLFLAACSTDEKAFEDFKIIDGESVKRGEFTHALLCVLEREGMNQLTYAEILNKIAIKSIPSQNPQCEGLHRDRILFQTHVPSRYLDLRKLHRSGDKYIMDAGTAYGITEGTEFTLYQDQQSALEKTPLGTLFVTKCNTFDSELCIPSNPEIVALQTNIGIRPNLLLHVPQDDSRLDLVFKAIAIMECSHAGPRQVALVEKDDAGAVLEMVPDRDGSLFFKILDGRVTRHGLTTMPYRVENRHGDIISALYTAAHYYWHLGRTIDVHRLHSKIEVEFVVLEDVPDEFDEDFQMLRRVRGENLIQDGVIQVVADTKDFYGMKITNRALVPVYVSVFYFNNSDFTITSYYQPGVVGKFKVDPCIKENGGSLTIGYGAGGTPSFRYTMNGLPKDQAVDVGFIKVFITTHQVDFSNVPTIRQTDFVGHKSVKTWDTILIPVVQRRMT